MHKLLAHPTPSSRPCADYMSKDVSGELTDDAPPGIKALPNSSGKPPLVNGSRGVVIGFVNLDVRKTGQLLQAEEGSGE